MYIYIVNQHFDVRLISENILSLTIEVLPFNTYVLIVSIVEGFFYPVFKATYTTKRSNPYKSDKFISISNDQQTEQPSLNSCSGKRTYNRRLIKRISEGVENYKKEGSILYTLKVQGYKCLISLS